MSEEIVVTGIGLTTPLGCGKKLCWDRIKNGDSLIHEICPEMFGQEFSKVARFSPLLNLNGLPRIFPLALMAAQEACSDASIDWIQFSSDRIGCSVSVSKPILPAELSKFSFPYFLPDSIGKYIVEQLKLGGPRMNIVAACATGIYSILQASRWLTEKKCDVAIAGSVESSIHPFYIAGFKNLGILSDYPRPFDKRRNGFMMGEGAGILILERKKDAVARKSRIYAELSGCWIGSDTHHPTSFDPSGSSIASVMDRAVKNEKIDYINMHGTGTPMNDLIETRAIKKSFGKKSYNLSLSSTKASTGHLLGAAGSVEAAVCCLAIRDQFVPPTAHLEISDPECDLDYTPQIGKSKKIQSALSLSFGFGGSIGAALFKRV